MTKTTVSVLIALLITATSACELGEDELDHDALDELLDQADDSAKNELPAPIIAGGQIDNTTHLSVGYLSLNGNVFCSGQLVTPTIFLTAGHCTHLIQNNAKFALGKIRVGFGDVNWNYRVKAKAVHTHGSFDMVIGNPHDIGLVVLEGRPAYVPIAKIGRPAVGQTITLTGYGANDWRVPNLRKTGVSRYVSRTNRGIINVSGNDSQCGGDSGSAAMRRNGAQNVVLSILSYGNNNNCTTNGTFNNGHVDLRQDGNWQVLAYIGATLL